MRKQTKASAPQRVPVANTPSEYIAYGEVGHADDTPMYAWIVDNDRVHVEVTLRSGDEIIARLGMDNVDGGGFFMPLHYGAKVVVAFPGGDSEEAVIIARVSDAAWPFPEDVCGVSARGPARELPMYTFLKTAAGQLLAIESGIGGDVMVHSGANIRVQPFPGHQLLLNGRTHIGSAADFTTEPTGDVIGPAGEIVPGVPGAPYVPTPGTNATIPPALAGNGQPFPADGIVRFKDQMQSNATVDPVFWTWLAGLATAAGVPAPPPTFASVPTSASLNTCSDD